MGDEQPVSAAPATTGPPESEHPMAMFMRPSLRLSKRQKVVLGLCPAPGPPTEKQRLRNEAAGQRLKRYHEDRRKARSLAAADATAQLETIANVTISKKSAAPRVQIKKPPVKKSKAYSASESEQASESELEEPVRRVKSKRSEPETPPVYVNPFLHLFKS